MSRITHILAVLMLTVASAAAQTWQIDTAHSRAQFTVRHLVIADIRGDFGAVTGTVDYDGKDLTKAKVNATIDVKSISTRVEARDEHLKTDDFLDVANHPTMTFVSTSITPKGKGTYNMAGNLTIRGTTKPVVFELTQPAGPVTTRGATKIGASASGRINRKDFGVKYHEVLDNGGLGVADEVFIQLDVELIQRAARPSSN
ncbi:MAG TPA: YceI family protein [Vicinamibacterales bacterium]|nr:YceI family protein [Vicinamibacterales bacterium]